MAKRQTKSTSEERGPVRRAASKVTGAIARVASKLRRGKQEESPVAEPPRQAQPQQPKQVARPVRRDTDIPIETIAESYSPTQTSTKSSFRDDGRDRSSDQELARGVLLDDRFNDEDAFTNKSGDPRIGTHRRTYEPNERGELNGHTDGNAPQRK